MGGRQQFELRQNLANGEIFYVISPHYNGYRLTVRVLFDEEGFPFIRFQTQLNPAVTLFITIFYLKLKRVIIVRSKRRPRFQ